MAKHIQAWLFLVTTIAAICGAAVFGTLGYLDTTKIVDRLHQDQDWQTSKVIDAVSGENTSALVRLYAALELDTLEARNGRAAAQLATRTWLRFLTTLFGAILIVFGAAFVLGRVTASIEANGQGGGISASLKTTSPGIILAAFGVFLVAFPLWASQEITTWDGASFGTFNIAEGPDGPIATVSPGLGGGVPASVPIPSDDEIKKQLAAAAAPAN